VVRATVTVCVARLGLPFFEIDFLQTDGGAVARLQPGDRVVYRKQKSSVSPGPRAKAVFASPKGEAYHYVVDKYWIVHQVFEDGSVEVRTRQGKVHRIDADDPRLRPATWWEKLLYSNRFPSPGDIVTGD
jgi:hypothetical protein